MKSLLYIHRQACMNACTNAYMTYIHTCIQSYIHTYIQSCMHSSRISYTQQKLWYITSWMCGHWMTKHAAGPYLVQEMTSIAWRMLRLECKCSNNCMFVYKQMYIQWHFYQRVLCNHWQFWQEFWNSICIMAMNVTYLQSSIMAVSLNFTMWQQTDIKISHKVKHARYSK